MRASLSFPIIALAAMVAGCGEDVRLARCLAQQDALRVDDISTLENVLSWPGLHDAPTVEIPVGEALERRVTTVQVLVMHPVGQPFIQAPSLTVEVFPGADPRGVEPWRVRQALSDAAQLDWFDVVLTRPQSTPFTRFRAAWWTFDFTGIMPPGPPADRFLVSVAWPEDNPAPIGYSNFDLDCTGLWGIYPASYGLPKPTGGVYSRADGWIDVGIGQASTCSYPMLRVEVEDITAYDGC